MRFSGLAGKKKIVMYLEAGAEKLKQEQSPECVTTCASFLP